MKISLEEGERLILLLAEQLGHFPTKEDISKCDYLPSYNTLLRGGVKLNPLRACFEKDILPQVVHHCENCSKEFNPKYLTQKFCSRHCAAVINNTKFVKRGAKEKLNCLHCGKTIARVNKKYCCTQCKIDYELKKDAEKYLEGKFVPKGSSTKRIKSILVYIHNNVCSGCGISSWQGKPITLELEHKDGNSENNSLDNLCLLCPNCHSQTPTYKGRNIGNGRWARRQRYLGGKSY